MRVARQSEVFVFGERRKLGRSGKIASLGRAAHFGGGAFDSFTSFFASQPRAGRRVRLIGKHAIRVSHMIPVFVEHVFALTSHMHNRTPLIKGSRAERQTNRRLKRETAMATALFTAPSSAAQERQRIGGAPPTPEDESKDVFEAFSNLSRRLMQQGTEMMENIVTPKTRDTPTTTTTTTTARAPAPAPTPLYTGKVPSSASTSLFLDATPRDGSADANQGGQYSANPAFFQGGPDEAALAEESASKPSAVGAGLPDGSHRRSFTQAAQVGRRASVAAAKVAITVAATPKKAIRRASMATSAFTDDVLEGFEDQVANLGDPTSASILSTEQHEIVEKLVYAKMKKIMQEREAAARENESRAQAADGGPEA